MVVPNEGTDTLRHFLHCLKSPSLPFKVVFQYKPQHFAHTHTYIYIYIYICNPEDTGHKLFLKKKTQQEQKYLKFYVYGTVHHLYS